MDQGCSCLTDCSAMQHFHHGKLGVFSVNESLSQKVTILARKMFAE